MGSIDANEVDALIVGAGFGGCHLLHLLRKNGFKTKVLEAGSTLGGVWCWNRYPGARVDCEMPYYGYSDPDIWSTFTWTERYPSDSELRSYFQHVDNVWDLSRDISLRTRVVEARFRDNGWDVKTSSGDSYRSKWFVAATGTSAKPYIPKFDGSDIPFPMRSLVQPSIYVLTVGYSPVENFKGEIHHSSLWPEQPVDLANKRVAIVGAGATAIQVMQEASKVASSVTEFIRTPNFAIPMRQRKITEDEIYAQKALIPHIFRACRTTRTGLPIVNSGKKVFDDPPEARKALWEEQWKRGGFNWSQGSYTDHILSAEANLEKYNFWLSKTRPRIKDPKKRDLLAPLTPPYYMHTKRPSLEQDYFESCDQPHVEITNSPIVSFTETGIQTEEKHTEFDIIAVCTGYDAVTGGLRSMGIKSRNGIDLDHYWQDGVATNLGMIVHDYPNMFMVYGPQAPTSLTNGPPFIEMQCEWILSVIQKQCDEKIATVEAKKEAQQAWREHCLDLASKTLAIHTDSWYMGANVPGKKREYLIYMGGIPLWHQACLDALEDWKGFEVQS